MNRREAIAALVSLPSVAKISTAPVRPKDVIVVECADRISLDTAARIKAMIQPVFPDQKIVVLDKALKLKVLEGQE